MQSSLLHYILLLLVYILVNLRRRFRDIVSFECNLPHPLPDDPFTEECKMFPDMFVVWCKQDDKSEYLADDYGKLVVLYLSNQLVNLCTRRDNRGLKTNTYEERTLMQP